MNAVTPKLELPNITLILAETRATELAQLAVDDCVEKAVFGDIHLYTDGSKLRSPGAWVGKIPDYGTKRELLEFLMYEIAEPVTTSHLFYVEWDSGIYVPSMWKPEFLEYDYIGAPWWYTDGLNVGNGGFSLRSAKLVRFLKKYRGEYPVTNTAADDLLCRHWRPSLEQHGFKWAPDDLAMDFAFECVKRSRDSLHFGYHGLRNWRYIYQNDDLLKRLNLAENNPYIKSTTMLDQFWAGAGVHSYWEN